MDLTARTTRLPRPGETVHAHGYTVGLGGKGANQAAAAARLAKALELDVALAGRVGVDAFGTQARRELAAFGVNVEALRDDPYLPTGIALIGVDAQAENCITVAAGANFGVTVEDVAAASSLFARADVLLLQLEIPPAAGLAAARAVRERSAGRGRVIFDPAPAPEAGVMDALWPEIDVITPNEHETGRLTGITPVTTQDAAQAAAILHDKGVACVLVKMGGRGVFWSDGRHSGFQPPFEVETIDTVAAGDCFNAGLAVGLALGRDLGSATRIAAACGALATTRRGAAAAAPSWADVQALSCAR